MQEQSHRRSVRGRVGRVLCGLALVCAVLGCSGAGQAPATVVAPPAPVVAAVNPPAYPSPPPALPTLFDDLQRRSFDYFWETANPANGLVPDRWPNPPFASIAAVGFALTAYPIGVERGYVSRAQARERTLNTVRFFRDAVQGPQASGTTGYKGFFYHFLDMRTGQRFGKTELSTVDTSLLLAGMLFAQSFFDGADAQEREIRSAVDAIMARVDWVWAQQARPPKVSMGWLPESGYIISDWVGYNESTLVMLMALASPQALPSASWRQLTATFEPYWLRTQGYQYLSFQALFAHQFTHLWVDFRGIQDDYMRAKGIDYFENSRRATYAQRDYAVANPMGWKGYDATNWGLSASDGPQHIQTLDYAGRKSQFRDYFSRGIGPPEPFDDGTIAPSAAASSLPFAPELVVPTVQAMHQRYGATVYGRYGFLEAFNPSFVDTTVKLSNGRMEPGFGWVDTDYLGLDIGPILIMTENYRSDFVWRVMRQNPHLRRALTSAGFSGGWLGAP